MDEFTASDDLFGLPAVHTRVQLYAEVLAEKNRKFKDSDPNDIDILTLAVPYCDLVVTAAYMAQAAKRRGLDRAFGTAVVPGTNEGIASAASTLKSPAQ